MSTITIVVLSFFLAAAVEADYFALFPTVDQNQLAQSMNITLECLNALNQTTWCDADLLRMAGNNFDNYLWSSDNLTDLCGDNCWGSVGSWSNNVEDACGDETVVIYGKKVDVASIAGRYYDGINTVCQQDRNTDDYCIIQSQDWVGVDVVRSQCANDTCPESTIDPANARLANLYSDDVLCSDCFITLMYTRLSSPYLPDVDHSEYLIEQYFDILDVCNATSTMPELVVAGYSAYENVPAAVTNTTSFPANCTNGQQRLDSGSGQTCDQLSIQYGVSTGDLQAATGSDDCKSDVCVCLPPPCTLLQVNGSMTCDGLAASVSTTALNVTTTQFLLWNLNLIGLCNDVQGPQYVCSGAPGGSYTPLPPINGTNANANDQNRFGSGGDSSIDGGSPTTTSDPSGTSQTSAPSSQAPSPTQSGISPSCTAYAKAASGDYCTKFAQENNIAPTQLYAWNTVLGSDGASCSTSFFADYYYCIAVSSASGTTSSSPSTPTSAAPSPTQSGIAAGCSAYAKAVSSDYCTKFAQENNITPAQLYAWNTILGPDGADCSTALYADYYYCVAAPAGPTPPTSTTTAAATPSPVQSGMVGDCTKFAEAVSGDYCEAFAQKNNIAPAALYAWNTVLGANGANCATQFYANYYYCVAAPDSVG